MKKTMKTPLAAAMGVAFISSFAASAANAQENPFGVTELASGYMQLAEAKTGEMACGANMKMDAPSDLNNKTAEGACAAKKAAAAATAKGSEGKCGNMMDGDKMKKGMEAACGAMMKGKEGACGAMPAGEKAKEGACGSAAGDKAKEAACGSAMKMPEGSCGAGMKMPEGACGAGMKAPAADAAKPAAH
jgi:uncharacterized low-complexity protein